MLKMQTKNHRIKVTSISSGVLVFVFTTLMLTYKINQQTQISNDTCFVHNVSTIHYAHQLAI